MDHRDIGQQLELFTFSPLSPGCPIWLPKGMKVYNSLLQRIKKLNEANNHVEIRTPLIWKPALYQTSGHLTHYSENMFSVNGEEDKSHWLKPMNCPGHMELFKSSQWSYRDLPIGFAEYSPLHRNEVSGAIGGLTRCRCFCQDDAHVFCSDETLQSEIIKIISMVKEVYQGWFGMNFRAVLSTRPAKFIGEAEKWDKAEAILEQALKESNFENIEISKGEGAFYGPKIDFIIKDSIEREWQTATIQLDFQLPENFELEYQDVDNSPKRPIVIHRAIFGSFERFIGILLESTQGKLPFWLAPVSVEILPISEKSFDYAHEIYNNLISKNIRAEIDKSNSTISQKIVKGYNRCIPCLAIVGEKEKSNNTVMLKINQKQEILSLPIFISRMEDLNQI